MPKPAGSKRDLLHLELLRLLAIYLVLFNHSGDAGFSYYTIAQTQAGKLLSLFFSLFDKIAVPLFFMISGALLLEKEESLVQLFRRRVLKFVLSLTVFTGFYLLFFHFADGSPLTLSDLWLNFYARGASSSSWFFYAYLSFLVFLPLLRPLARSLQTRHFLYLAALQLLFSGFIPLAEQFLTGGEYRLNPNFYLPLLFLTVFFPLMGHFLERVLDIEAIRGRHLLAMALLSVGVLVLSEAAVLSEMALTGEARQTYFPCMTTLPAATVYLACKKLFTKRPLSGLPARLLARAGCAAFGVYFFDPLLRSLTRPVYQAFLPYLGVWPSAHVWTAAALLLGLLAVSLLKKIPGVRYLL